MGPFRVKVAGVAFGWSQSLPAWCKNPCPSTYHTEDCASVETSHANTLLISGWENKGGKEELPGTSCCWESHAAKLGHAHV